MNNNTQGRDLRALLLEAATLLDGSTDEARRACADRLVEAAERVVAFEAVVHAAVAQEAASAAVPSRGLLWSYDDHRLQDAHYDAIDATEAAVRAMREAVRQ